MDSLNLTQVYNTWIQTAIRPSPGDCPFSIAQCLLKGKPCQLRHVPIISEEQYYHRKLYGQMVAFIQKFSEKFPLSEAHYQSAKAFESDQAKKEYWNEKKQRDYYQHLITDHTPQSYDIPCSQFLNENCKLKGYVEKPQKTGIVQKSKLIKKICRVKKDHSFMDQELGFGGFRHKTWKNVEKYHSWYIDWVSKSYNKLLERQKALIIISKRLSREQKQRQFEQRRLDLSFMDVQLGFGQHKEKTWAQVERIYPGYIDWTAKKYKGTDCGDFARIIQEQRKKGVVKMQS